MARKTGSGQSFFARVRLSDSDSCPCGGAALRILTTFGTARASSEKAEPITFENPAPTYGECCAPLHRGERLADNACELMAARYSAYAAHEADFIWQTWHPRFRPEVIQLDDDVTWEGLDIDEFQENGREAVVEFRAHFTDSTGSGHMRERSNFQMRGKRWMYLDGDVSYEGETR